MRRFLIAGGFLALVGVALTVVWADPPTFRTGRLVQVSGASPFGSCTADNVAGQIGRVFPDSEVEPWVDVNPRNADHIVGSWQQDRWSNGGARGLVAGVSVNGGRSWQSVVVPGITACSGNPDFERASDPWLSFAPNGELHHVSLSIGIRPDGLIAPSALLVSKSIDGGFTWSAPITVIRDEPPTILNDKQSLTADPADPNFVYLIWDRIESPQERAPAIAFERALGFRGPTWFSRTTDAGASWEPARQIFDPGQEDQTIGNQIVVLPDGTLIDVFNLIFNFKNAGGVRGFNVALLRSTDRGVTWSGPIIVDKLLTRALTDPGFTGVRDPDTNERVRTGDIIPEVAVDRNPGSPGLGTLYVVWQDSRFSGGTRDEVAFSQSSDGGFTWSAPIKINRTPATSNPRNQQAFTPAVRVSADGTIGVTYYDFRNNTPDPGTLPTDAFIVHCHPATSSCGTSPAAWIETRLTNASFDMRLAPIARGFFVGDYEALGTGGGQFMSFFSMAVSKGDPASIFFRRVGP